MVYIDATHTFEAVTNDLDVWYPKLKEGGFLCGHDYAIKRWEGVVKAVDNFVDQKIICY